MELDALRAVRIRLAGQIIAAAFAFNMVLRFYPWPVGLSLNNLRSLSANIVGIAFSLLFYVACIAVLSPTIRRGSMLRLDVLLVPFLFFLAVSPLFRASPATEVVRDVSFLLLLTSAAIVATAFNGLEPEQLRWALRGPAVTVVGSYALGFLIALARPGSVAWGSFFLRGVHDRAEFFFFFVPPHLALIFIMLGLAPRAPGRRSVSATALGLFPVLALLSLRTHTRTYIIGLVLLAGFLMVVRVGRRTALLLLAALALVVILAGVLPLILAQLRLDSFGQRGIDSTNGRASLVDQVLIAFRSNVAFGSGADGMRRLIEKSSSVAKTEYGMLGYIGSFGLMSVTVYVALFLSWTRSAKRIWRAAGRGRSIGVGHTLDSLNLANFPLTFFWLLGSATAFYDWLTLLVAFMCLCPGRLWRSEDRRLGATPSSVGAAVPGPAAPADAVRP